MRNIWKQVVAVALSLALCLSFAGCYDENKTWAARQGEDELPIGAYIYYLYSAYSEASDKVDSSTPVLDAEIEGEDATQWIKDRAMNYLQSYYYIEDKFQEYGLELSDEDQEQVDNTTNSVWPYYQSTMEKLGIARSSFEQAYSLYSVKFQKVMTAMYGEGGELALDDSAYEEYYTGAYINYEYFSAPFNVTTSEGETRDLTDEEKESVKEEFEKYVDKINAGDMTMSEAADDYATATSSDSSYMGPMAVKAENLSSEIFNALNSAKEGEAAFVETSSMYLVVRKLSIQDYYNENIAGNEDQLSSLLSEMKGTEFNDYVLEQATSVEGIEVNTSAINSVKVSTLVNDSNRNGTSSASEATSSSSESDSSSEEITEESSTVEESSSSEESSAVEESSSSQEESSSSESSAE